MMGLGVIQQLNGLSLPLSNVDLSANADSNDDINTNDKENDQLIQNAAREALLVIHPNKNSKLLLLLLLLLLL